MRAFWAALLGAWLLSGFPAMAAEWGGITPGVTTQEAVRERYRNPSHELREKLEGYATTRWVYEGARAPVGLKRMVVDFGLLTPQGFRPTVVRALLLEPNPRIFERLTVIDGWGFPDRVGTYEGNEVFFYTSGLIVTLSKDGAEAVSMLFTIPQPEPPKPPGQ